MRRIVSIAVLLCLLSSCTKGEPNAEAEPQYFYSIYEEALLEASETIELPSMSTDDYTVAKHLAYEVWYQDTYMFSVRVSWDSSAGYYYTVLYV